MDTDVDTDDWLVIGDSNNFEIHNDMMRNWLILVGYFDADNVDYNDDEYFDYYYYDENIYRSLMKNSMVMTRKITIESFLYRWIEYYLTKLENLVMWNYRKKENYTVRTRW
jgi:hypothetical protein